MNATELRIIRFPISTQAFTVVTPAMKSQSGNALMFPDWLFIAGVTTVNAWVEIGNLMILNAVAFIVGQRVEREGQARLRAEGALRASEVAEARYRALFDEQHAPVLVTDSAGVVAEANAAATSLLGT